MVSVTDCDPLTKAVIWYIFMYIFLQATTMAHVSFTDLRQNMASYFDRVSADREPLLVTRQGGKGNVVILSEEEFAGWQETVHLLSSPRNAARLLASIRELEAGQGRSRELIEDEGSDAV
jgi:antitoxin YefM